ncbi:hypothetical protein KFK09_008009 [Dendrobium nobile]|uniref:Uncharacterized protein n=1 Tax=Dendrobium nobile TaxID=94219 RepID=A0A8T3BYH1_DENNO|nr:hypothetical protein KFK09_008009 [Dendrobium nobile]
MQKSVSLTTHADPFHPVVELGFFFWHKLSILKKTVFFIRILTSIGGFILFDFLLDLLYEMINYIINFFLYQK